MLPSRYGIAPTKWGARCNYDIACWDYDLQACRPWNEITYPDTGPIWVVHWGGGAYPYRITNRQEAMNLCRGWDRFHTGPSRKWRGIAYNWILGGGAVMRGRGNHPNGAHKNSTTWGHITRAVCFQVTHKEIPLMADRHNFAVMLLREPGRVTWHDALSPEQDTQCAGPWLKEWVTEERYISDFGMWERGDTGPAVRSIRARLGMRPWRYFTRRVKKKVIEYQQAHGLTIDGVVGPETYRSMIT